MSPPLTGLACEPVKNGVASGALTQLRTTFVKEYILFAITVGNAMLQRFRRE